VPLEVAMTGLPGLEEMRSLNKPGLSLITLVFTEQDQRVFRPATGDGAPFEVGPKLPEGIAPVLGPVSTGLGEVYQYTLDKPDDGGAR
jgi:cobalt-zinc-cadmium resistance protein CzcA